MFSEQKRNGAVLLGLFLLVGLLGSGAWGDVPATVNIHGQLLDSMGNPLSGARAYLIRFYDSASGFTQLGGSLTGTVEVTADGLFNLSIAPPAAALESPEAWYEVAVDSSAPPNGVDANDIFLNRVKVQSVPYALQAAHVDAAGVGNGTVNNTELETLHGATGNVQTQLNLKSNAADVYTKTEVDSSESGQDATIEAKANASDVYTKAEVDSSQAAQDAVIADKANTDDVYTKTEVDSSQSAQDSAIVAKIPLTGPAYVVVPLSDSEIENATNLQAAYTTAKSLTPHGQPLSATNRAVVLVSPGRYNLETGQLILDTEFVDLVGLSTARDDQYVFGISAGPNSGVIRQTADDVRIENLLMACARASGGIGNTANDPAAYYPESGHPNTRVRNCEFRADSANAWAMRVGTDYAGSFTDCTAGDNAFGSFYGDASGTFTNCSAGSASFGGVNGDASGKFVNCTAGDYSFAYAGIASGTFTHCTAGNWSFARGGTASGTFTNCKGGMSVFGGYGISSGTFVNCAGTSFAFGGGGGTASGTYTNCTADSSAFGSSGTASGTFTNCVAGYGAFGGGSSGVNTGGKFYGCRMTYTSWDGTFRGRMEGCTWSSAIVCGAEARIYRSNILGNVDLGTTAAGIAQSAVKGTITNATAAAFNLGNLADSDVN